jgi:CMP/dCMP kinase
MIIAIDGPAGSGKSTVAKAVAARLGFHYLDTGAMYRAVAVFAADAGIDPSDEGALGSIAREQRISFEHEAGDALPSKVFIGGRDVTAAIRTPEADAAVSAVAGMPAVRTAMVEQQRALAETSDTVVEGRDIGTVVFPGAELKVFLTASPEERARRRTLQHAGGGHDVDAVAVLDAIVKRDTADSTRVVSPLTKADDAVELDTTGLTAEQVIDAIVDLVQQARS